jgi:uncharacterized protein (UPF0248 family)
MFQTLKLLLPALVPSWRFFDVVAPSPRVEFVLLETAQDAADNWQEFRPRPAHLSIGNMLKRMFWNPRWNESLFLVSCAERLIKNPTEHSAQEIVKRIKAELARGFTEEAATPYLQFRLVFVYRHGAELQKHIIFISPIYSALKDGKS